MGATVERGLLATPLSPLPPPRFASTKGGTCAFFSRRCCSRPPPSPLPTPLKLCGPSTGLTNYGIIPKGTPLLASHVEMGGMQSGWHSDKIFSSCAPRGLVLAVCVGGEGGRGGRKRVDVRYHVCDAPHPPCNTENLLLLRPPAARSSLKIKFAHLSEAFPRLPTRPTAATMQPALNKTGRFAP